MTASPSKPRTGFTLPTMAVVAALFAAPCPAAIVYVDIPDAVVPIVPAGAYCEDGLLLDIDGIKGWEVSVIVVDAGGIYLGAVCTSESGYSPSFYHSADVGCFSTGGFDVYALSEGDLTPDPGTLGSDGGSMFVYVESCDACVGEWCGRRGERFLPFALTSGPVRYGWIRIQQAGIYNLTVLDYAYEDTPGVPILAGDTGLPKGPLGDLDGDGVVGAADLGMLLGAWDSRNAAADLDHDGIVGAADLGLLLGNWS